MEPTFGTFWAFALLPALFGFGILLIVLARRPSKFVGVGAGVFSGVCLLITIGLLVDGYDDARKNREFTDCLKKQSAEQCMKANGKMGFIGNEAYAN